MRTVAIIVFVISIFSACQKSKPSFPVEVPHATSPQEPVQQLAREAAQKIHATMRSHESSEIAFEQLESREIFSQEAFTYFVQALAAQLASAGIQRSPADWKLHGVLSKQEAHVVFSFRIFHREQMIASDSARIPDDERLKLTLAQFNQPEEPHPDHSAGHKEMPVPTPLAQLNEVPLDITEHCSSDGSCSLLLLYADRLVQRNWADGTEKEINLTLTGDRSRAPSGKIVKAAASLFLITNQLALPVALNENLQTIKANFPQHLPQPERGVNTYTLADGRFFDFEELGTNGLAVVNTQNHLAIADRGKLIVSEESVGGSIEVSLPYIYASSTSLPAQQSDSIHKFVYDAGLLRLEKSQTIDGIVYDITITDLNRDHKEEMLLTVRNQRGIFIEVREPF